MFQSFYTQYSLLTAIAVVAAFAVWRGGWPERVGAGVNLIIAIIFELAQQWLSGPGFATVALAIDGVLALSFLALAVRFAKTWLGIALLLQAIQFALHAYYYVVERQVDTLFAVVNNLVSWGLIGCILGGVVAHWIHETRRRRAVLTA